MTQENKELLLKDLSVRLSYGVRCSFGVDDAIYEICGINLTCCGASEIQATHIKSSINGDFSLSSCKPYLFPLTYEILSTISNEKWCIAINTNGDIATTTEGYDWLNAHHYDYRNLIKKGLANDATGLNIY